MGAAAMTESAPGLAAKPDAIQDLVRHVVASRYEDLSPGAVAATKTFILDALGVAIVGTLAPGVPETLPESSRRPPGEAVCFCGR